MAAWQTARLIAEIPLSHWLATLVHWFADHWHRREAIWGALTTADRVGLITLLVATVTLLVAAFVGFFTIVFQIIPWIDSRRSARRVVHSRIVNRADVVEEVSIEEIKNTVISRPRQAGELEPYIETDGIRSAFGAELIPRDRKILFCGASGAGKTREARELILRLNYLRPRTPYMCRQVVPSPLDFPQVLGRNPVILIDDLVCTTSDELAAELEPSDRTNSVELLEEALDYVQSAAPEGNLDVIITIQPQHFAVLQAQLPDLVGKFQVVWLGKATSDERRKYIQSAAYLFGLTFSDDSPIRRLEEEKHVTFGEIFNSFWVLKSKQVSVIDNASVEALLSARGKLWRREVYPQLDAYEKRLIDCVADFLHFGVNTPESAIIEVCATGQRGWKWLARKRYRDALDRLVQATWLDRQKKRKRIDADENLITRERNGAEQNAQLRSLTKAILEVRPRVPVWQYAQIAGGLSTALFHNDLLEDSILVTDSILELPSSLIGTDWDRALILYRQGRAYEARGRDFWGTASQFFERAVALGSGNYRIEHSLASLYRRSGKTESAKELFSSIAAHVPTDLPARVALLQMAYENHDVRSALTFYMQVRRLLRRFDGPERSRIIAQTKCIDFISWYGNLLRDRGDNIHARRRFNQARRHYEVLLDSFPEQRKVELSAALNGYGCLLYDEFHDAAGAILKLKSALAANPKHTYSLHKLASIYLDQAAEHSNQRREYLASARPLLTELLKIDPTHYMGRLHLAMVHDEEVDWERLTGPSLWSETLRVYRLFCSALEPVREGGWSQHNAFVHNKTGSWLWQIEAIAHRHGLAGTKPIELPTALDEFMRSIASIKSAPEEKSFALVNHKILTWFLIGSYLIGVKGSDPEARNEGFGYLRNAVDLSAETGKHFDFSSESSYVESYLAKAFLERGDQNRAKGLLESSVRHLFRNWTAWRMLGDMHKRNHEWSKAIDCFLTSAEGFRDKASLEHVAVIAKRWMLQGKISVGDFKGVKERITDFNEGVS